jgi:hypothetical protein
MAQKIPQTHLAASPKPHIFTAPSAIVLVGEKSI